MRAPASAGAYNSPVLTSAEADVLNLIDRDRLLADLSALIAFPSLGGHETPAQEWMAATLSQIGLDVDVWEIDFASLAKHPAFSMEVARESGLGVVGTFGDGPGPTLVLNGHVDVVPIGDRTQWTVNPWEATVRDGAVFGRGACDMKGGLAAALAALRALAIARVPLPGRVAMHSVIAEEDGGAGTLATILRGHRGDGAVSMEPTTLILAPAHAGALTFRITVPGVSAHGCVREEGVSAIETFRPVHDALLALEAERNARLRQPLVRSLSTAVRAVDRPHRRRRLAFVRAGSPDLRGALRHRARGGRRRRRSARSRQPSMAPRRRTRSCATIRRRSSGGAASSCRRKHRTMPRSSRSPAVRSRT